MSEHEHHEELMELKHDAVPGYYRWFWIIFIPSLCYIVLSFFVDWPFGGQGH